MSIHQSLGDTTEREGRLGSHRYKAPAGEVDVNASAKAKRVSVPAKRRTATKTAPAADNPLIEANMNRPIQEYSMRTTFEPGDRVAHPKFGLGVVEGISMGAGMGSMT